MRKAIREFLESKLRALKQAHSEGAIGRDLPGRIIFWPPPKNVVEARLHGILEGLRVVGKINEHETSDWHSRFRSVLAVPGDPGTVVYYTGDSIPADVRARNEPWPADSVILAIEPAIPARDYDTGLLALTRVELYPVGVSLYWRLDLLDSAPGRDRQSTQGAYEVSAGLIGVPSDANQFAVGTCNVNVRCRDWRIFAARLGFKNFPRERDTGGHATDSTTRPSGSAYRRLGRTKLQFLARQAKCLT